MHGAITEAGQIRLERIWTTAGRPEGWNTWMYSTIQPQSSLQIQRIQGSDPCFCSLYFSLPGFRECSKIMPWLSIMKISPATLPSVTPAPFNIMINFESLILYFA